MFTRCPECDGDLQVYPGGWVFSGDEQHVVAACGNHKCPVAVVDPVNEIDLTKRLNFWTVR